MCKETEDILLNEENLVNGIAFIEANPQYGFYLVRLDEENKVPIGMIFVTPQNQNIWWFSSIYVDADHRRKGNLTLMSKKVM